MKEFLKVSLVFENEKKISTNSVVIVERRTPDVEPINLLLDDKMYFMSDMTEDRKYFDFFLFIFKFLKIWEMSNMQRQFQTNDYHNLL